MLGESCPCAHKTLKGKRKKFEYVTKDKKTAKKLKTQAPLEVLKNLLGHSSIETTSIYINPTEDMVKKQMSGVKLYGS